MPPALPATLDARLREWAMRWGTPELPGEIDLRVSTRLRTTLGHCRPQRSEIRVAAFLLEAPAPMLEEVVCHELAHAAVFRLHGRGVRPHGSEWQELMRNAGFAPRARVAASELLLLPASVQRVRVRWEHRCNVCRVVREAGRPVPQWRCASCRRAGREGAVTITRQPPVGDSA